MDTVPNIIFRTILVLVFLLGCGLYYFLRSNKKENNEVKKESKVLE